MKRSFLFPLKFVAFCTALIFSWNQIVWADGILAQDFAASSTQQTPTVPVAVAESVVTPTIQASTTTDFLSSQGSPLSVSAETKTSNVVSEATSPVSGAIMINSGAAYTASRSVTLNLSAASSVSSLNKMSFSTDGKTWSAAVTYATSKAFTLSTGDGVKTVYVKYYDKAGNVSQAFSSTIVLDTHPPVGTVKVSGGVAYISQTSVILDLSASDAGMGVEKMSFSTDGKTWSSAEAYGAKKSWTFSAGDGKKTVYVKFQDKTGKWSAVASDIATLDTVKPTGSININSGAAYAKSQTVTLNLSGVDRGSGISSMSFSTDGMNWTVPATYATSQSFTLPAGDGTKTVYVKYFDKAGNASLVYSKSIVLDTTPPSGVITINGRAAYTSSRTVTLNLSFTDGLSGMDKMSFSTNGTAWSTPAAYATSKALTLPFGDGTKTVYIKCYDKAGNASQPFSSSIVLDTHPPMGTVKVNGGATYISQTAVMLDLSVSDTGLGVNKMSFSADGKTWGPAETYMSQKAWTFSAGDGKKTVYVKFQDKTGNWSAVASVAVTLDTVKPTGSININSGAVSSASQTMTLNLLGADSSSGISSMSFSADGVNWTASVAYAASRSFTLPAGDGTKTVHVKYFDKAGNASLVYSKSIVLDTQPPQGTVTVNGGSSFINQTGARLDLSASDTGAGIGKMSFSTNGTTWTTAEAYAMTKAWTFPAGDGAKKVYVKFQDKAGNWSVPAMTSVTLDKVKPTGSISINSGATETRSPLVTLNLSATDSLSGINTMSFSVDNVNWTMPETYAATRSFTLPAGDGLKTVFVKFYDKAGNVSAVLSKNIQLKKVGPVVVIASGTPILIHQKTMTLHYTSDGVAKQKVFSGLLEGDNVLTITETDLAGNPTTVTYKVAVDTIAPVVAFTSAAITKTAAYVLTYTVDGVAKSESRTLVEGANNLSVIATDLAGNTTTKAWSVTLDTIAPVVVLTSPALTKTAAYMLTYTVDGVAKSESRTLVEGANNLSVTATDLAGNTTTKAWSVALDTVAPLIAVTSTVPVLINAKTLTVNYTADGLPKTKTFSNLAEGSNTLTITETDSAGNQTTVTKNVTVDTIAPVVVIDPATPTLTKVKTLTINYTLNGVAKTKSFANLAEGANTLSITETDLAGNQTTVTKNVTVDTIAPAVMIDAATPSLIKVKTFTINYTVDGVAKTKNFTNLAEGANTLLITETDAAGNQTTVSWKVAVNTKPAEIIFTSASVATGQNYTLTYTVDGVPKTGTWLLGNGVNQLMIRASNAAGIETVKTYSVTWGAPQISDPASFDPTDESMVSMTTQSGLILKYKDGNLVSIEKPEEYTFYSLEFDASQNLKGGLLVYPAGSQVYYKNDQLVWTKDPQGTKYCFNADGSLRDAVTSDNKKTVFSYEKDAQGKTLFINAASDTLTARYTATGKLLMTLNVAGDVTHYDDGILSSVHFAGGSVITYEKTVLTTGTKMVLSSTAPQSYPSSVAYDLEGKIKEVVQQSGVRVLFENGVPSKTIDLDLVENSYDFDTNPLGDFAGFTLSRLGYTQRFDETGNLKTILTPQGETFSISGTSITGFKLMDGTSIRNFTLNAAGDKIVGGTITAPDGVESTYVNGRITQMKTPEGLVYAFTYDAQGNATASLSSSSGAASDVFSELVYDKDMNLVSAKSLGNELLHFINQRVERVDIPGGSPVLFQYTVDPLDPTKLIQVVATQGETQTTYDGQGHITHSTVQLTEGGGSVLDLFYQYDRMREVKKNGALFSTYAYEFDSLGNEITVVTETQSKIVRRYQGSRLISLVQADGMTTQYSYGVDGKVSKTTVSWKGRTRSEFTYSYEGDITYILDEEGITQGFDADGKLVRILQDGDVYAVHQLPAGGPEKTAQELVQRTLSDGLVMHYQMGKVIKIEYPDGTRIEDIIEDSKGALFSAKIYHPNGSIERIVNGKKVEIVRPDGTVLSYIDGKLVGAVNALGVALTLSGIEALWKSLSIIDYSQLATTLSQTDQNKDLNKGKIIAHAGDLITVEMPDGRKLEYTAGKLSKETEAGTQETIEYSYEGANIIISESGSKKYFNSVGDLFNFVDSTGNVFAVTANLTGGLISSYRLVATGVTATLNLDGTIGSVQKTDPSAVVAQAQFFRFRYKLGTVPLSLQSLSLQSTVLITEDGGQRLRLVESGTVDQFNGDTISVQKNGTIYEYQLGQLTKLIQPNGDQTLYGKEGDLITVTKGDTTYFYDAQGALKKYSARDSEGLHTWELDPSQTFHKRHTVEDAQGLVSEERFDSQNRLIYLKQRDASNLPIYSEEYTSYITDGATGNTLATVTDKFGALLRREKRDSNWILISEYFDPALTAANVTRLTGMLNLVAFGSEAPNPQAMAGVSQLSSSRFNIQYSVRNPRSFAGSISAFDDFSTSVVENADLSGLSSFIVGLRLQSGSGDINLEFQDASVPSHKFQVMLGGVKTTEQFYFIPTSIFSAHGVDLQHIANINLVVISEQVTSKEGALEVDFGNHPFKAVSTVPGAVYDPSLITVFPDNPALTSGSGNTRVGHSPAGMALVQPNISEFSYNYDLHPDSTSFTFARIANGDFVDGVFQGTTMSLPQQLIIAAQGSVGGRVKVQIRDNLGRGGQFILELQPYMQNFTLNLVSPNVSRLFNRTQVAEIIFVQDTSIGAARFNDSVRVQTNGLAYTAGRLPTELPTLAYVEPLHAREINQLSLMLDASILNLGTQVPITGPVTITETGNGYEWFKQSLTTTPTPFTLKRFAGDFNGGQMAADDVMYSVFDAQNNLISTVQKNGTYTEYEQGKVKQIWDKGGVLLVEYTYDTDGTVISVSYPQARKEVEEKMAVARLQVEIVKMQALLDLATQNNGAIQQIETEYNNAIVQLQAQRSQLEGQRYQRACRQTLCWTTCETVEVPGVAAAIGQVNNAINQAVQDRESALLNVSGQVDRAKADIESQIAVTFAELDQNERQGKENIQRQEITPVVFAWYRKILGRDPSLAEYDRWIAQTPYDAAFNLQGLKNSLLASTELVSRTQSVAQIKLAVRDFLNNYYGMTNAEKLAAQDRLGIRGEAVALSRGESDQMIAWINSQGLHFGQSAYLALEAMLEDAHIAYTRETLAADLILIDILTGILTPIESGDLVLSLYALKKKAGLYGLEVVNASLDYDSLLALPKDGGGILTKRLVAHVNKDHFVIITKVAGDQVTYIDPGMGADHQNQVMTATKGEFISMWDGSVMLVKPAYDFLQAMPQPPPAAHQLTTEESMRVRGAFFGSIFNFFKNIFVGAFNLVVDLITLSYHQLINFFTFQFDDFFKDTKADLQQIVTDLRSIADISVNFIADTLAIVPFIGKPVSHFFKKIATFVIDGAEVTFRSVIQALPDNLQDAVRFFEDPIGGVVQILGAGMQAGLAHTLTALGVSPEKAQQIAGIAVGAVKMVAGTVLFGVTGNTTVLAQGFYDVSTGIGFSPTLAAAISIAGSALVGGAIDGNPGTTVFQALKNATPKIAGAFAQAGVITLGGVLGLDPRLSSLLGMSAGAVVGGAVGGALDPKISVWNAIKTAVTDSKILGGMVSIGASIGLDAIGAPPMLQSFVPGLLNQLAVNLSPGTGSRIFSNLMDNVAKFGKGILSAGQQLISFGAKVMDGIGSLTKAGFAKAVEFFSGIFDRPTQETLIRTGGGSIENAILNNTIVLGDTARVTFGGVDMTWNQSTGALRVVNGNETRTFSDLRLSGSGDIFFNQLDYYNQLGNGSSVAQTYLNNQLWNISFSDSYGLSLAVQPVDSYTPITFDGLGNLQNGQINYSQNEWLRFVDGAVVEARIPANGYGMLRDPFQINTLPDNTVLLPSSGITAGDLKGLDFSVTQDASGNARIELGANGSAQQEALDRLFGKLRSGAESFEKEYERLKNRLLLFGNYTDAELEMHKELEIQKVLADSGKIYVISCKSNAAISYAIRGSTYQLGDNDSVNHSALAFRGKNGQMYVLDIEYGGKGGNDLAVTPFTQWASKYVDIQAQDITLGSSTKADQIRNDVIFNTYVNYDMTPRLVLKYDYLGAIFGGGLNFSVSESSNTKFCSSLVYDIMDEADITLSGLNAVPDPNELRHAIEEYQRQAAP